MQPLSAVCLSTDYTKAFFPVECSVSWRLLLGLFKTCGAAASTPLTWAHRQTVLHGDQHSLCHWASGRGVFQMLLGHFLLGAWSDNGAFILWRLHTFWVIPLSVITSAPWKAVKDVNVSELHSLYCESHKSITCLSVTVNGITEQKKTLLVTCFRVFIMINQ